MADQICSGACDALRENALLPGRRKACTDGCALHGPQVFAGSDTCQAVCASGSWAEACATACQRYQQLAARIQALGPSSTPPAPSTTTAATTTTQPPCSAHNEDCDACSARANCGFCYGQWTSQHGEVNRWSACYSLASDDQGDPGAALCEEEDGAFAETQETCPAPVVDKCADVQCDAPPTCDEGQRLQTTPPGQGACCPTAVCVDDNSQKGAR